MGETDKLKEHVAPFVDKTMDQAGVLAKRVDTFVRENPWVAVACGVLVGLGVVAWIRRR